MKSASCGLGMLLRTGKFWVAQGKRKNSGGGVRTIHDGASCRAHRP